MRLMYIERSQTIVLTLMWEQSMFHRFPHYLYLLNTNLAIQNMNTLERRCKLGQASCQRAGIQVTQRIIRLLMKLLVMVALALRLVLKYL